MSNANPNVPVEEFKMPPISIGEMVLWYAHGTKKNEPHVAIVTKLGHRSITVSIIPLNNRTVTPKEGVRYITDPDARMVELEEQGAWDYTEQTRVMREVAKTVLSISPRSVTGKVPAT